MYEHDATEIAYKHGYDDGYAAALKITKGEATYAFEPHNPASPEFSSSYKLIIDYLNDTGVLKCSRRSIEPLWNEVIGQGVVPDVNTLYTFAEWLSQKKI